MITDHCVFFFDDWVDDINFGEYRAYSEFLNENKDLQSIEIGTYYPTGKIFCVANSVHTSKKITHIYDALL